jgi:hypothetical protein
MPTFGGTPLAMVGHGLAIGPARPDTRGLRWEPSVDAERAWAELCRAWVARCAEMAAEPSPATWAIRGPGAVERPLPPLRLVPPDEGA